ncbi:MAG: DUF4160 domain-containing protein, partial [Boseongicola sp. SB0664_bin_43]|nr:DUF4160 domain-containing protein [Boseongicola sp. SB0664_bin_43]
MPTIHRARGFRFVIYFNDHMPVHVHAIAGPEMARITLEDPDGDTVIEFATDGISPRELRWLRKEVADHRDKIFWEWSRIHG